MSGKRRAISAEQKSRRRQAVIDCAWRLFQEKDYAEISMNEVAVAAGLAKGTLYLYFETKEALFLAVQEQRLAAWFEAMDEQLRGMGSGCSPREVAALLRDSLEAEPGLVRLFTILHVILEKNIDLDTARRFKITLLAHIAQTGALLEGCLPYLSEGQGAKFILHAYALVIGLGNLTNPAPVVQELMETEPELGLYGLDFSEEFFELLTSLLQGLQG
jgi:AcrR family transcriptional regulator